MDITENYRIDANFRHFHNAIKANEELCLAECGIEQCRPDKSYGPVIRDEFHIHVILDGKGILETNHTSYSLQRGQIFAIFPGIRHYYFADTKEPWHYTWISFSGSRAADFVEKAGITARNPTRNTYARPEQYLAIIEKILNRHQLTIVNELTRTSLLYEAVALLIDSQNQKETSSTKNQSYDYSPDIYVNSAVEYIQGHYNKIRVSDIAS